MLHQIKPIKELARLVRILDFQRRVLAFACDAKTKLPVKEKTIRATFLQEGDWFWKKLYNNKGEQTGLCKALESLIQFCQQNPTERQSILDAFDHDTKFHDGLDDPAFRFSYTTVLTANAQAAVKDLMVAFYKDLLMAGFPTEVHGHALKFDRDEFIKAFYEENITLKVCSGCDGQKPSRVDDKTFADADHFFAKSIYPFLSVHWANLVPLCLECNRIFKGDRDPVVDHSNAPLLNIFHPYSRPAILEIEIAINRTAAGEMQLGINEKKASGFARLTGLNHVFRLEKRWLERLEDAKKSIEEEVREWGAKYGRLGTDLSSMDFQIELRDLLASKIKKTGREHFYFVHSGYLSYALTDGLEFDTLHNQFLGN